MLNVFFDATVLIYGLENEGERRGIYFVAQNILDRFLKHENIRVILFSDICRIPGLKNLSLYKDVEKYAIEFPLEDWLYRKTNFFRKKRLEYFFKPLIRKFFALIVLLMEYAHIFLRLPLIIKMMRLNGGLYFSPLTAAPFFMQKNKRMKKYVFLHDTIPYRLDEYKIQRKGEWFGHLVKSLNSEDIYFANSRKTKEDFCDLFPQIIADKVFVTPLAASKNFRPCRDIRLKKKLLAKYKLPEKKYAFSLCTLEPRKNIIRSVRAFVRFLEKTENKDIIFVLGGGGWNSFVERIKSEVSNYEMYKDYIVWAGYIDDEDLPFFYSNAEWFVYTSQYEGFGLPPLEAMQCGCPVITSNNSSLPEVVGDAGIMIDWDSDEQHIEAYEQYYFNEELRKENSRKGLERAKQFSWEKTVDKMIDVMKEKLVSYDS